VRRPDRAATARRSPPDCGVAKKSQIPLSGDALTLALPYLRSSRTAPPAAVFREREALRLCLLLLLPVHGTPPLAAWCPGLPCTPSPFSSCTACLASDLPQASPTPLCCPGVPRHHGLEAARRRRCSNNSLTTTKLAPALWSSMKRLLWRGLPMRKVRVEMLAAGDAGRTWSASSTSKS
jgi:hypothetical protein